MDGKGLGAAEGESGAFKIKESTRSDASKSKGDACLFGESFFDISLISNLSKNFDPSGMTGERTISTKF